MTTRRQVSPGKTPDQVLTSIETRLSKSWHLEVDAAGSSGRWPASFPFGAVSKSDLETRFAEVHRWSLDWQEWAIERGVLDDLDMDRRDLGGAKAPIPARLKIQSAHAAAALLGRSWVERLDRAAERRARLLDRFPELGDRLTSEAELDGTEHRTDGQRSQRSPSSQRS